MVDFPKTAQGAAMVIDESSEEFKKDQIGLTAPNLHRRITTQGERIIHSDETSPRQYEISVRGYNSYNTVTYTTHDEESTETEIP